LKFHRNSNRKQNQKQEKLETGNKSKIKTAKNWKPVYKIETETEIS